jgi:hypothetical protein
MSSFEDTLSSITINQILTNHYNLLQREQSTAIVSILAGGFCLLIFGLFTNFLTGFPDEKYVDPQFHAVSVSAILVFAGIGLWLVLSNAYIGGWHLFNRKKLYEILFVQSQVIRRSYLINFDLVEPVGKDRLEKIFNHLCLVFPQINEIREKKQNKNKNYLDVYKNTSTKRKLLSTYNDFQLVLQTSMGLFFIKTTDEKMNLDNIKKITAQLNKKILVSKIFGGPPIFRVVISTTQLLDEYDSQEFKNELSKIPRKFALDLIFEDEFGYSTISID